MGWAAEEEDKEKERVMHVCMQIPQRGWRDSPVVKGICCSSTLEPPIWLGQFKQLPHQLQEIWCPLLASESTCTDTTYTHTGNTYL